MTPPPYSDPQGAVFIDHADAPEWKRIMPFLRFPVIDEPYAENSINGSYAQNSIRALIGCEYSAVVRDAFRARGFDAWSCDLLPCEGDPRWHIQGDVLELAYSGEWDMAVFHPPCTDLAVSGARHFAAKIADGRQGRALDFVRRLLDAPIKHIALENPVSIISSHIRKPDCTYQPWMHGHGEVKRSCLWLKNLPVLKPSNIVEGRDARIHKMAPGPDRWKERSRTLPGVAAAFADQFGGFVQSINQTVGNLPKGDSPSVSDVQPFHTNGDTP